MTQLSTHLTLEEMTASSTAARLGIDNTPTPRAMENLKLALRLRLGRGPLTEDQANAVATALDAAAVAVERT